MVIAMAGIPQKRNKAPGSLGYPLSTVIRRKMGRLSAYIDIISTLAPKIPGSDPKQ